MPKKALYVSARAFQAARDSGRLGIESDSAFSWARVREAQRLAQGTYAGDQEGILASKGITLVRGRGRFTGPRTVAVGDVTLAADAVIVATGSEPVTPPIPGADLGDTSAQALFYDSLPSSLAIVGAGFIAFELAGIFASFGVRVTVLARGDGMLTGFQRASVEVACARLEKLGAEFITEASIQEILRRADGGLRVTYAREGSPHELDCDRVLLATGRRPALRGLDLAACGIELDERGAPILDSALRSSDPNVFFAGDAAGDAMFTPVAGVHGAAIANTLLTGEATEPDVSCIPIACFTVPELARVGFSLAEAQGAGIDAEARTGSFEWVGAAIIENERDGVVTLIVDPASSRLLGAEIVGPSASDLIYSLALAVKARLTTQELAATRAIHPALSEAVNWAAW
jgi:pyruvate/2-oxoglutarate dehydrogenase complex dihydrolipoamide dehydrogenase (E3) component